MTTRSATVRGKMPTGREEVAAAILEAATDLFAERGPAATSIRDIAARSKVNHGLVFRHFGTKDRLVGAVLDHLGTDLTDLLRSGAPADVVCGRRCCTAVPRDRRGDDDRTTKRHGGGGDRGRRGERCRGHGIVRAVDVPSVAVPLLAVSGISRTPCIGTVNWRSALSSADSAPTPAVHPRLNLVTDGGDAGPTRRRPCRGAVGSATRRCGHTSG